MTETIKIIVDAASTKNLGIKSTDKSEFAGKWFNYAGINPGDVQAKIAALNKGDYVELTVVDGKFTDIVSVEKATAQQQPTSHAQSYGPSAQKSHGNFMDDYVTYEELLDKLKEETNGKYSIETKMLVMDTDKKVAVCSASVRGEFGTVEREKLVGEKVIKVNEPNARWAHGHGDCDSQNGGMVKDHYIRMAETRAIARALRAILGIGKTSSEEMKQ